MSYLDKLISLSDDEIELESHNATIVTKLIKLIFEISILVKVIINSLTMINITIDVSHERGIFSIKLDNAFLNLT